MPNSGRLAFPNRAEVPSQRKSWTAFSVPGIERHILLKVNMPPQPLSKVNPSANYEFGTGTFYSFPHLASVVAEVIALGSMADHHWSYILAYLLKADPQAGMAMYEALSGAEARRSALTAAARVRLNPDDFQLFQAVGLATAHSRRLRNDFAHHVRGKSKDIAESLLLIDPKYLSDMHLYSMLFLSDKPAKQPDKSLIKVWDRKALREAAETANDAVGIVMELGFALRLIPGAESHFDEMRARLLARPAISQILQKLSQQTAH